jgi:RimJ/RimL family protein N-acetyltransferase
MQGKGYAAEAAEKVKDYAFNILKVKTLVGYIDPKNEPSISLAIRLGAVYEKDIELLDFGLHCVYRYNE